MRLFQEAGVEGMVAFENRSRQNRRGSSGRPIHWEGTGNEPREKPFPAEGYVCPSSRLSLLSPALRLQVCLWTVHVAALLSI